MKRLTTLFLFLAQLLVLVARDEIRGIGLILRD